MPIESASFKQPRSNQQYCFVIMSRVSATGHTCTFPHCCFYFNCLGRYKGKWFLIMTYSKTIVYASLIRTWTFSIIAEHLRKVQIQINDISCVDPLSKDYVAHSVYVWNKLTVWSVGLLEKLPVFQLVKTFTFYEAWILARAYFVQESYHKGDGSNIRPHTMFP